MRFAKWIAFCLLLCSIPAGAQAQAPVLSKGQTLYLPIYSHIWYGENDRGKPDRALVSVLVSIRNADPTRTIFLRSARYYDTDGKELREYVASPRTIRPMGTMELFIPRSDDTGGSGANFVIAWHADTAVNAPVVEALHINLASGSGRSVAFTTSARPIAVD